MNSKWMPAVAAIIALLLLVVVGSAMADQDTDKAIKDLKKRIQKLEVANAKDAVEFGGDLRIEAHNITGEIPDHYNGMALQQVLVNTLAFHEITGNLPMNPDGSLNYTGAGGVLEYFGDPANYGSYRMFSDNLQFGEIPGYMQSMIMDMVFAMAQMQGIDPMTLTPEQIANFAGQAQDAAMAQMLAQPGVFTPGYDVDNDILYTTRLRLDMHAKVADNVTFDGRLAMYKPWGASTQIPMFNGSPTSIAMDANSPGVPGGEFLRVERAYFSWKHIAEQPMYLSLGRRPSTGGPPLHFRHDEMRAGTPLGTIIDFQFDGATFGYNVGDKTVIRACYGLGYESQFGNGSILKTPADRLDDASFFGFNVDAWNTEEMQVQATVARAFNITDGFNGYVIMPNNPVTGQPMPGPIVTRYSPSANLGDFDLASLLVTRRDGPVDWFVSGSWSKSKPEADVDTPFGSLFADPMNPGGGVEETGSMYYLGARLNLNEEKTKVGVEFNHGSEYWFNFAPAQDDVVAPKTSTRGNVWETYVTHRVSKKFIVKLDWIHYDYEYTGSGWHLGAPKKIDEDPVMGFPSYSSVDKLGLSFIARF